MTDFVAETRHYCRNPRCRSKLPAPVANTHEAFCARGCFNSFYLHRCIVCERAIEQPKRGKRLICKRAKCRNALGGGLSLGRYHASQSAKLNSVKADSVDVLTAPATDIAAPAWRIVAGPELTASQFHCATIADGPNCEWKGGEYQRIEARNRALLREHFRRLGAKAQIQRHHAPVNVVGGYRFPGAPDIDLMSPIATAPAPTPTASAVIGDGLDIPGFLLRRRAA
jgi:hypothetical protein